MTDPDGTGDRVPTGEPPDPELVPWVTVWDAADVPATFGLLLDADTRRTDRGQVLVGGSPLRIVRVREAGSVVVDAWQNGEPVGPKPGHRRLARRLLDAGLVHPEPRGPGPFTVADVTVVIPMHGLADDLERTLAAITASAAWPAPPAPSAPSTPDPTSRPEPPPAGRPAVVVVDDASDDPDAIAAVAERWGARLVRHERNAGPAAARNTGLDHVDTALVAFVDCDVEPDPGWLDHLLPHLADPRVAVVAPRIRPRSPILASPVLGYDSAPLSEFSAAPAPRFPRSRPPQRPSPRDPDSPPTPTPAFSATWAPLFSRSRHARVAASPAVPARAGAIDDPGPPGGPDPQDASRARTGARARFEQTRSPLDLGPRAARVVPGGRVAYVPSTVLLARRDVLEHAGRFDDRMRFGEDVDLVWRIIAAGHTVRYEPSAVVRHPTRSTVSAWLRQRYDYGTAAAALDARHPRAVPPLAVSGWTAVAWALTGAGHPFVGAAVVAGTAAALARRLPMVEHPRAVAVRLAGGGQLAAWRPIASALTRTWWPVTAAAAIISPRARRAVILAALVPPLVDWVHGAQELDPFRYTGLRLLDDLAYGTGVWAGCLRAGHAGALMPTLHSWPGQAGSSRSASEPTAGD